MTLGQTIQRLRREKNLLQDDLADLLGVSRQSVSKWETDTAVPELDRLLQLSELFGVTLDELVRGEAPPPPEPPPAPAVAPQPAPAQPTAWPPRKIAGTILLCFGGLVWLLLTIFTGDLLGALAAASPFLLCGVICSIFRQRVGLWCAWTVYVVLDAYLRWVTSTYRRQALMFSHYAWQSPVRLMMAWALMLGLIGLIAVTLHSYRKMQSPLGRRSIGPIAVSGASIAVCYAAKLGLSRLFNRILQAVGSYSEAEMPLTVINLLQFLLEWLTIAALTILLVRLAAVLRGRRKP